MIASMTAFGRTENTIDIGHIIWEIRSVNHRYLEVGIRLPEELRMLESTIRERVSKRIKRGKIDCILRFEQNYINNEGLSLNNEYAAALIKSAASIQSSIPNAGVINPMEVLRWPGVIIRKSYDQEAIDGPILKQLDDTLDRVIETRLREGKKIYQILLERCNGISEIVSDITKKLPEIMDGFHVRLSQRTQELKVEIDNDRMEQEILLLTQKFDITEELDRLATHVEEVRRVLDNDEPVGRRLDFLMQELNREANTLGSKSAHIDCSSASVELKVLIEQMREQIQNIE